MSCRVPAVAVVLTAFASLALSTTAHSGGRGSSEDAAEKQAIARLERVVRQRVDQGRSTGIVAGILFPSGRSRVVAYGDAGSGARIGPRSVFEIGSITKVLTTTLLADMAVRGEVELDAPVARYLPRGVRVPERGGRRIRLVDLATHTSGLPRIPSGYVPKEPANPYAHYGVAELYRFLGGYTLTRGIGSRYEYSNLGVGLLGHALALRSGWTYEQILRERVLEPLGMSSTAVTLGPGLKRRFVTGHDATGQPVPHWDFDVLVGAGGVRSTVGDLLRFAAANLPRGGGPLEAALQATHRPRRTVGPQVRIGLGWHLVRPVDRELLTHNGGTDGFSSFLGIDLPHRMAIVVLSNSPASIDDIGFNALDSRVPLTKPPKRRIAIQVPAAVLAGYVGVYQLPGLRLTITRGPRGLVARATGQPALELRAESRSAFFVEGLDVQIAFTRRPGGNVTGLVLTEAGVETRAQKIR